MTITTNEIIIDKNNKQNNKSNGKNITRSTKFNSERGENELIAEEKMNNSNLNNRIGKKQTNKYSDKISNKVSISHYQSNKNKETIDFTKLPI